MFNTARASGVLNGTLLSMPSVVPRAALLNRTFRSVCAPRKPITSSQLRAISTSRTMSAPSEAGASPATAKPRPTMPPGSGGKDGGELRCLRFSSSSVSSAHLDVYSLTCYVEDPPSLGSSPAISRCTDVQNPHQPNAMPTSNPGSPYLLLQAPQLSLAAGRGPKRLACRPSPSVLCKGSF